MPPTAQLDRLRVVQTYLAEKAKKEHGAYARTAAIHGCSDERVRQIVKAYQQPKLDDDLRYQPAPGEVEYRRQRPVTLQSATNTALLTALLVPETPSSTPPTEENAKEPFDASPSLVGVYLPSSDWDVWQTDERPYEYTFPPYFDKWHPYVPGFDRDFWPTIGMSWMVVLVAWLFAGATWRAFRDPLLTVILFTVSLPYLVMVGRYTGQGLDTLVRAWRLWLGVLATLGLLLALWWTGH